MRILERLRALRFRAHDARVLSWAWAYLADLRCRYRLSTISPLAPEVGALVVRRAELHDQMRLLFPHPKETT